MLAREEERRRLRRDLHDGLGPALAGLSLQVDTVRNTLGAGPEAEPSLLGLRVRDPGDRARRPPARRGTATPALDDLGLVESVRELARRSVVPADVEAEDLPRLPAAVEVAAYRVVQEALTNVARHSAARRRSSRSAADPERCSWRSPTTARACSNRDPTAWA